MTSLSNVLFWLTCPYLLLSLDVLQQNCDNAGKATTAPKHSYIRAYREVEVKLHLFQTSTIDTYGWLDVHISDTGVSEGLGAPSAALDMVGTRSLRGIELRPSGLYLVTQLTELPV